MPKHICTEPVCRHEWSEARDSHVPRCPRCGGFWVRVASSPSSAPASHRQGRLLVRRPALA